jgi:hypothetical protein
MIGFITTYGYRGDTTPDRNSAAGIGAWDNPLGPCSLAVSRDIEARFRAAGITPRSKVALVLENGQTVVKTWDDRTAKAYKGKPLVGRFDFFCPSGHNPHQDQKVVAISKLA